MAYGPSIKTTVATDKFARRVRKYLSVGKRLSLRVRLPRCTMDSRSPRDSDNTDKLTDTFLRGGSHLHVRSNGAMTTLRILPLNAASWDADELIFNDKYYPAGNRVEFVGDDRLKLSNLNLTTEPSPTCDPARIFTISPS